jgi:hypothetical protein
MNGQRKNRNGDDHLAPFERDYALSVERGSGGWGYRWKLETADSFIKKSS